MCAQALEQAERTTQDTSQEGRVIPTGLDSGIMDSEQTSTATSQVIGQDRPLAIKTEGLTRIYKVKGQKRSRSDKSP